jgi:outer membrane protein OmpA-like peptidoglycan-associated protein
VIRNVSICTKPNLKVPLLRLSAYWESLSEDSLKSSFFYLTELLLFKTVKGNMKLSVLLFFFFNFCFYTIVIGKEISFNVYYESGKYSINNLDSIKLDSIAKVLLKAEKYKISINSYCDSDGSEKDNLILAQKRCYAISSVFVANKLKSDSIFCSSIGELKVTNTKLSASEKEKHRRSEIHITYSLKQTNTENQTFSFSEKDLVIGKKLVLPAINFVNGTADFLVTSYPSLLELLKVMKKYPTLEIEIGGHVCCSNNFPISKERAFNVYNYLKKNGISEKRMKYKGFGKTQPIFEDDKEESKAKANRRVEITILKY